MKFFGGFKNKKSGGGDEELPPPRENKLETAMNPDDNGIEEISVTEDGAAAVGETEEAVTEAPSLRSGIKRVIMRFTVIFVFLLIIFIGLTVVLYPYISNFVNTKNASRVLDSYSTALNDLSETDYSGFLEAARAYNARLSGSGATVKDAFGDAEDDVDRVDEYWSLLDISGNGVMGYVEIPQLDIRLPVYHGVSEVVLAQGAGHIQGSSLPVGGESVHAVVSAHTGLPRAKFFTGVDTMEQGDTFALHVLNEVLTYEVNQILRVLPHEVEALSIAQGEDYVTLVTCTPYGINSHRLLIRGTRIETPSEEVKEVQEETAEASEEKEPGWFKRTINNIVAAFAFVIEKVAQGVVSLTESVMDLFGVEY